MNSIGKGLDLSQLFALLILPMLYVLLAAMLLVPSAYVSSAILQCISPNPEKSTFAYLFLWAAIDLVVSAILFSWIKHK